MGYLFAAAVEKAKKHGYGSLDEAEKWDWHADVYGWRRVVLSAVEPKSPCDPHGKWYDEGRAQIAEHHYRAKLGRRGQRQDTNYPEYEAAE